MNQCLISHYAPLIAPTQIKLKTLLFDVVEWAFLDEHYELPDEPFYVYFDPEETEMWGVAEKIGEKISVRFKGKEVTISYFTYLLCINFDNQNHVVADSDDLIIDCDIIRGILFGEITTENISEVLTASEDEQILIDEMLKRSRTDETKGIEGN